MAGRSLRRRDAFGIVRDLAGAWPDVEAATRYDGAPVLRCRGCFMAGLAREDTGAEPGTLAVRIDVDERPLLIADAPEIYYLTAFHAPHPVVLVRLARIDRDALRGVLALAHRATLLKAPRGRRRASDAARPD